MVCHWKEDDYRIVVGGGACLGAYLDMAEKQAGIDVQLKMKNYELKIALCMSVVQNDSLQENGYV